MSFVAVDLGASSSRYVSDSGQISVLPNNIVMLAEGISSHITPDATDIESCLEVHIEKLDGPVKIVKPTTTDGMVAIGSDAVPTEDIFPATFLMGIMADRFTSTHLRPSVNTRKCLQVINYISAITTAAVSRLKYELSEDINLYLAVPPNEIHMAREAFKATLPGKYKVTFGKYMGGTEVTLNIVDVKCYEESYMASTSFFFNMNGIPKDTNKKYLTGTVLSLDIGASTTDLAIIKNGRYMDKSGQTYRAGGNEARDYLADMILANYDIQLEIEDAERTMAEGRLQRGNNFVEIGSIVSQSKEVLARKLTTHMQTYFKRVGQDISTINAIVVSGGGSMQSQYVNADGEVVKTSEPMSYYVTKELLSLCSGTEVVAYGEDARFANVKGLFIRAKVDAVKGITTNTNTNATGGTTVQSVAGTGMTSANAGQTASVASVNAGQTASVAGQASQVAQASAVVTQQTVQNVATAPVANTVPSGVAQATIVPPVVNATQPAPTAPVVPTQQ